jgi:FixJ family two-component response regulator
MASPTFASSGPFVVVVDPDQAVREELARVLSSVRIEPKLLASVAELLELTFPSVPSCLIIEFRLPLTNGLEVQKHLCTLGIRLPVIFISAYGDIDVVVRAMKAGARDFLSKPIDPQRVLDSVHAALEYDATRRRQSETVEELRSVFDSLTAREWEVMWHVTAGLMNKQVAHQMGLSEITVKVHRGRVMRKTRCRSLAELVSKAQTLFGANRSAQPALAYMARVGPVRTGATVQSEAGRLPS